jgi:hypothetical protein
MNGQRRPEAAPIQLTAKNTEPGGAAGLQVRSKSGACKTHPRSL